MIYGVGTDLVEMDRVMDACAKEAFLNRVYTESERREALKIPKRLAGDFAVKEAVSKAMGTGFTGFGPIDIEVLRDPLGKPYVVLHGTAKEIAEQSGIAAIHVSISDTESLVTAYAVAETR